MSSFLAIALLLAQAVPAPDQSSAPASVETAKPAVEPWDGTLAQGLAEVQRLSEAEKPDEALALAERLLAPDAFSRWREKATTDPGWKRRIVQAADPLLAAVGLSGRSSGERATVHLARGVVLAGADRRGEAAEAFEKARALAGPGDLRLDATYDLGWTALTEGEALRAKIPEIAGASAQPHAAPPAPPTIQGLPGQPQAAPDPLVLAREAYLAARERFVERLKSQWEDADTRANVELVQRRLRELSEIEKKREEEKKKQEQQQKEQQKQDGEQKPDEQKQDQDQKDQQNKDQEKKDEQQGEQPKPDEQKPDPKPDEKKPEEQQAEEDKDKKGEQPQPASEEQLSKEEVMRLLDILKGREQEGEKLLEQLRQARRASVKKDW